LALKGSIGASGSRHGTTTSIPLKNSSRLLFRAFFSKLAWLANVICRIAVSTLTRLYPK
jgi:hypothetical protein